MSYRINIREEAEHAEAMSDVLEHIAGQLREGYTSGYYPTWDLIDTDAPQKQEDPYVQIISILEQQGRVSDHHREMLDDLINSIEPEDDQ